MTLPAPKFFDPHCGACVEPLSVRDDAARWFCHTCGLTYNPQNPEAPGTYTDPAKPACGVACQNYWHGPERLRNGYTHDCQPCALPAGHIEQMGNHYHPCTQRPLTDAEREGQ